MKVDKSKFAVLGMVLCLGACVQVGPDFAELEAPLQEEWLVSDDERVMTDPADLSTWWEVFEDPVLTDLVLRAYTQNLTLQSTGLRILEARAQFGVTKGEQYPQTQDLVGAYSYNRVSRNTANFNELDRSFHDVSYGIDASWELDLWGKFARSIQSSSASLGASIAEYDDFLVVLTAEVARFYVIVREAEERIRLARENVVLQRNSLEIATARFRFGAVTELDVQQAQALLSDTESTVPELEILRLQAQHALAVLLGITPAELVNVLGGEGQIPTAPKDVAVGVPSDLLRRRPDIRQAELEAAAQSAQIGVARAELFPAFTLGGFVGMQSSGSGGAISNRAELSDVFTEGNSFTGFIGPAVSFPILNYGRLTNAVRVEDARFEQLITDYQNTVLEAYREVEDGLAGFLNSQEQTEFLQTSVDANQRAVELALNQYVNGAVDYTRVLETQTSLVDRQDRLASARSAIAQNLILTYRGLGGGWQTRDPNQFVPDDTVQKMRDRTNWGDILPDEKDIDGEAPKKGEESGENSYFRDLDL
ncbi:MAG: efflux transporter outer membrane subunit [Alphaproteobacteria bacterium]|nr:efflux transporter outer membrane subunit [Alphaproteobacteria bacterium]